MNHETLFINFIHTLLQTKNNQKKLYLKINEAK